ncbi:hypothetical protein SEVIR_2G360575v4 [Setaria viridis]
MWRDGPAGRRGEICRAIGGRVRCSPRTAGGRNTTYAVRRRTRSGAGAEAGRHPRPRRSIRPYLPPRSADLRLCAQRHTYVCVRRALVRSLRACLPPAWRARCQPRRAGHGCIGRMERCARAFRPTEGDRHDTQFHEP